MPATRLCADKSSGQLSRSCVVSDSLSQPFGQHDEPVTLNLVYNLSACTVQ